jgi:hypothetical protein
LYLVNKGIIYYATPRDQLGVKTVDILYNFEVETIYCVLDAPIRRQLKNI